jgi:hypothetical protein
MRQGRLKNAARFLEGCGLECVLAGELQIVDELLLIRE